MSTITGESGKFQVNLHIPDLIKRDCFIQAIFEGDQHYMKSKSNIVKFDIIKHVTSLYLDIDSLRIHSLETKEQYISMKTDQNYRIRGSLIDHDFNSKINKGKIKLISDLFPKIYETITDLIIDYMIFSRTFLLIFGELQIPN